MPDVSGLVAAAAAFMEGAGHSSGSRNSYRHVWDQFGQYCAANGVRDPDRETAARFCVAVGADGVERWRVFHRRAVGCLCDVAETGRFALRAGRGRIPVPGVFEAEFAAYAASLAGRGLAAGTVRAKTGMLSRFLGYANKPGANKPLTSTTTSNFT